MSDESPLDGFSSLLRLAGYNVPARARFVGESIFAGIYSATILGLTSGQLGWFLITPLGPIVPFLTGSTLGFGLGVWGHWRQLLNRTRQYARHYPQILAHALWVEHRVRVPESIVRAAAARNDSGSSTTAEIEPCYSGPPQHHGHDDDDETVNPMVEWVTQQGIRHLSMCALAAQSCQSDVEEVDRQERQRIIDAMSARIAGNNESADAANANDD